MKRLFLFLSCWKNVTMVVLHAEVMNIYGSTLEAIGGARIICTICVWLSIVQKMLLQLHDLL